MVNEERMRKTFTDLVKIYAPSKGEREVCDYLKKELKKLGASRIVEDNDGSINGGNSGNLIATFNGNAEGLPSIALTGHMDCVECCRNIEPVLKDGVFYSKGNTILGGDDKAGVTAILEGLHLMKETYIPHGKITVIFTVQEEIGLFGSRNIEKEYIQGIDFGYTLDADGPAGSVFNAGPSEYTLDFICHGVAAHAGMCPEKGTSAIAMAGLAIAACPNGRIDEETTCNLGTIEGGTAVNIVPDRCAVHGEARSRSTEKLERWLPKWKTPSVRLLTNSPKALWKSRRKRPTMPFWSKNRTRPCASSKAPAALPASRSRWLPAAAAAMPTGSAPKASPLCW